MVTPADTVDVPGIPLPDRRLRRHQRLTSTADFEATYAQGKSCAARTLVMWLHHGPGASLRLGVVASRVIGNAIKRARAKRRLREAWRLNRNRFHGEVDVVLVARRSILTASWQDVNDDLIKLARKAKMIE
ncbi:MAG: ribonuclease P protein component [bacterium]